MRVINPERPLTVCQILSDVEKYDGKIIEVRGPWKGGDLWDDCPEQKNGDWLWPNALGLVLPAEKTLKKPAPWNFSTGVYESARRDADRLIKAGRGLIASATFVGRLDVHSLTDYPPGTIISYGTLNSFRAHLVLLGIKDISAEQIVPINPSSPLTVCQVLENREHYRGKFIEIRGRFFGNSLRGDCPPINTATLTWDSAVDLALPSSLTLARPATWDVPYDWYEGIVSNAARLLQPTSETGHTTAPVAVEEPIYPNYYPAVSATILGRLETRDIEVNGARVGYGHLGFLPAQLIIVDVKDLKIQER
jgi:hypothetical protein